MPLPIETLLRVRGSDLGDVASGGADLQPNCNGRGDSIVALGLPPQAEIVRMGESYVVTQATAVAPVAALPTTTAQLTLWNGEPDTGRVYVIDSVFAIVVVSAAAASAIGIAAMLNAGKKTGPTGTLTPKGLAGHPYRGKGTVSLAQAVTDDLWHPLGPSVVGPASQVGMMIDYPVKGLYLVPPGHMFSTAVLANTATTITVRQGIRWHEVRMPVVS